MNGKTRSRHFGGNVFRVYLYDRPMWARLSGKRLCSGTFDLLDVVLGRVGKCDSTIRFLLEVLKGDVREVERDLLHRQDARSVRTTRLERRDNDIAEGDFCVRERISVATGLAA